jgi:hypothetical protein
MGHAYAQPRRCAYRLWLRVEPGNASGTGSYLGSYPSLTYGRTSAFSADIPTRVSMDRAKPALWEHASASVPPALPEKAHFRGYPPHSLPT